jgi:hypothetical protein
MLFCLVLAGGGVNAAACGKSEVLPRARLKAGRLLAVWNAF